MKGPTTVNTVFTPIHRLDPFLDRLMLYLDHNGILQSMKVNKNWYNAAIKRLYTSPVFGHKLSPIESFLLFLKCIKSSKVVKTNTGKQFHDIFKANIQHLNVNMIEDDIYSRIPQDWLAGCILSLPNLLSINAKNVQFFSKEAVKVLENELSIIYYKTCQQQGGELIHTDFVRHMNFKLEKLNVNQCFDLSSKSLKTLFSTFVNLRVVICKELMFFDFEVMRSVTSNLKQLMTLDVSNCQKIDDGCLELLSESGLPIQNLNISNCVKVTARGIASLYNLKTLRVLDISSCARISADFIDEVESRTQQRMFRDKSHEYNSTDGNSEGLKSSITAMLAHQCTNLVLYRNYESLSKFGYYFPNIKYLTLSCSSIIPRRSLKSFELIRRACMNFTHLETLELFDIYEKVQTQALLEIGLNAPKMKRIKLRATYGCNFGLNFENPANLYGLSDNSSDADSDSTFVADTTKTLEKMTPSVINRLNGICQSLGKDTVFSLLHFANPV